MTITISPEVETRLLKMAEREGRDPNAVADDLLLDVLEWHEHDEQSAIDGIRRGFESSAARKVRSADAVFADMRSKINAAVG